MIRESVASHDSGNEAKVANRNEVMAMMAMPAGETVKTRLAAPSSRLVAPEELEAARASVADYDVPLDQPEAPEPLIPPDEMEAILDSAADYDVPLDETAADEGTFEEPIPAEDLEVILDSAADYDVPLDEPVSEETDFEEPVPAEDLEAILDSAAGYDVPLDTTQTATQVDVSTGTGPGEEADEENVPPEITMDGEVVADDANHDGTLDEDDYAIYLRRYQRQAQIIFTGYGIHHDAESAREDAANLYRNFNNTVQAFAQQGIGIPDQDLYNQTQTAIMELLIELGLVT